MSVLELDDSMPMGKYQGELVSHVLSVDLEYCIWFIDEIEDHEFAAEIIEALESPCSDMAIAELLNLE